MEIYGHSPLTETNPRFIFSLKYEDCIPDEDLKRRIDAWVAEGTTPSNRNEVVSMDVDEVAGRQE